MLTIKENANTKEFKLIKSKQFDIEYFHTPEIKVDYKDSLSAYLITYSDTPGFIMQIDKETNTLAKLKLKDHPTNLLRLYLLNAYVYNADIKMASSRRFSFIFGYYYWSAEWNRKNECDYLVITDRSGYISEIQRVADGVEACFNADGK